MKFVVLLVCLALIFRIDAKTIYGCVRLSDHETVSFVIFDDTTKDETDPQPTHELTQRPGAKTLPCWKTCRDAHPNDLLLKIVKIILSTLYKIINVFG